MVAGGKKDMGWPFSTGGSVGKTSGWAHTVCTQGASVARAELVQGLAEPGQGTVGQGKDLGFKPLFVSAL